MPKPQALPATPAAPALKSITIPPLGHHWPEQGGHFAGIVAGDEGQPDYLLIIGPEAPDELNWQMAIDWAAELSGDDGHSSHSDYTLPNRRDQAVAYGNCKALFQKDWYWSSEQYAGEPSWAWYQDFRSGDQDGIRKYGTLRARAVRRLVIQ
jgi:hypothetical protein